MHGLEQRIHEFVVFGHVYGFGHGLLILNNDLILINGLGQLPSKKGYSRFLKSLPVFMG